MSTYPDAPGHRDVDTFIAAADDLAPKLGRLQRMAETTIRNVGARGLTADELSARANQGARANPIQWQRRPNGSGKLAVVWTAA